MSPPRKIVEPVHENQLNPGSCSGPCYFRSIVASNHRTGSSCRVLPQRWSLQDPGTVEQHEEDDDLVLLQAQLDAMRVLLFIYEIRINKMQ